MITNRIELVVPRDLAFEDLGLSIAPDGKVHMAWAPVAAIIQASGVPESVLTEGPPVLLPLLLKAWLELREQVGDPIAEAAAVAGVVDHMLRVAALVTDHVPDMELAVQLGGPPRHTLH